jgi:hypothetical protein
MEILRESHKTRRIDQLRRAMLLQNFSSFDGKIISLGMISSSLLPFHYYFPVQRAID